MRLLSAFLLLAGIAHGADDIVLADFEGKTYGDWKIEGDCFGPGPAKGTLERQNAVSGYLGERLVNTFYKGDQSTGKATGPSFAVERQFLNSLVGGGPHEGQTCMNLLVDGKVARTVTGQSSEGLAWDPDYQALLAAVTATEAQLDHINRFDMPGFRPNSHYVREMTFYGILPKELPADAPIDVYATDQAYWRSLWYQPQ